VTGGVAPWGRSGTCPTAQAPAPHRGGRTIQGSAGRLTLNDSGVAGDRSFHTPSDVDVQGGQVDPASANKLIGTGGSGGLVNGVNGNVVL
jgi:hypothetical protein